MKSFSFIKDGGWLTMTIAVIVGVFAVVGLVQAATTISTNVNTGGTLTVSGLSSLSNASSSMLSANSTYFGGTATTTVDTAGNLSVAGTLGVTGVSTFTGRAALGNASSTLFSVNNTAYFGGTATTTIDNAGNLSVIGTATVTGKTSLINASSTLFSVNNTAYFGGTATSSFSSAGALTIGTSGTAITQAVFGFCNLTSVTVTSTSSAYTICSNATGVTSSFNQVFVQATSSLPTGLIVEAASSTATAGVISVRIFNALASSTASTQITGGVSLNFWAIR